MMNRMKQYKGRLWLSSILTLLPIPVGFLLWNRLPNSMAIHWGASGEADGYGNKLLAILLPSLLLLGFHWLCILVTFLDKSNDGQNQKVFGLIFWICPTLSILLNAFSYAFALGIPLPLGSWLYPLIGISFVLIGNYMPKCKQNYTLGIKTRRTLADEGNWNATHRFSGKVWVCGGLLLSLLALLPIAWSMWIAPFAFLLMVLLPLVYSYRYDKRREANGETVKTTTTPRDLYPKWLFVVVIVLVTGILLGCFALMFSGKFTVTCGETALTVEASYFEDLTVEYAEIDRIEYRETSPLSRRIWGFGSAKLSLGTFENDEFGRHTRYTYNKCSAAIILHSGDRVLVINADTPDSTRALYESLLPHLPKEVTA